MMDRSWIWHHIPYVVIGILSLYLITEPGSHHSAPLVLYFVFLPLPLYFLLNRLKRQ